MLTPNQLKQRHPLTRASTQTVAQTRQTIGRILRREDHRLLVIAGPCSIHDPTAALEYAERLKALAIEMEDAVVLLMRTYLEKPRTTIGWRGFIADPEVDSSCDMNSGLKKARQLLVQLNDLGVPCATESLDPLLVNYTDDLISWTALGARTAESQVHRAMASGLPMPVGIKNTTSGSIQVAIDAVATANAAQTYATINGDGQIETTSSAGNPQAHVILRGGVHGPNFDAQSVADCAALLRQRALAPSLIIDCSHGNSAKQPRRQLDVLASIGEQVTAGNQSIVGLMVESHLHEGNQCADATPLAYGVSITDGCLSWNDTHSALRALHRQIAPTRVRAA